MEKNGAGTDDISHGARLDQADKRWHLTSPTPYDPPLSYGGWNQSQALGACIGNILHDRPWEQGHRQRRQTNCDGNSNGKDSAGKSLAPPKYRIVIHSSPYRRCVQTSVGLSAGIVQSQGQMLLRQNLGQRALDRQSMAQNIEPDGSSLETTSSAASSIGVASDLQNLASTKRTRHPTKAPAAELRLDAFLGEWLTPEYFDGITPPPGSAVLLRDAKAELARSAEPIVGSSGSSPIPHLASGHGRAWSSSGIWTANRGLANLSALSHALSSRARSSTDGRYSPLSPASRAGLTGPEESDAEATISASISRSRYDDFIGHQEIDANHTNLSKQATIYTAPIPQYAISSSAPIPTGYVAYARDACVSTSCTWAWDSSVSPLDWGDGGEHGEEWSSMHRRFSRGLKKMVRWYETDKPENDKAGEATWAASESQANDENGTRDHDDDDNEDCETVVVIVTHGAGCNALLGALTGQPVLTDVGLASLSLAIRSDGLQSEGVRRDRSSDTAFIGDGNNSSDSSQEDRSFADKYRLEVTASTEHLTRPITPSSRISPVSLSTIARPASSSDFPSHTSSSFASTTALANGNDSPSSWLRPSSSPSQSTFTPPSSSCRYYQSLPPSPSARSTRLPRSRRSTTLTAVSTTFSAYDRSESRSELTPTSSTATNTANGTGGGLHQSMNGLGESALKLSGQSNCGESAELGEGQQDRKGNENRNGNRKENGDGDDKESQDRHEKGSEKDDHSTSTNTDDDDARETSGDSVNHRARKGRTAAEEGEGAGLLWQRK